MIGQRLRSPPPDPQAPPAHGAASLVRALRAARGARPWTAGTIARPKRLARTGSAPPRTLLRRNDPTSRPRDPHGSLIMPKTNAERQAAYRRRHLKEMNGMLERLNMLLSLHAKRQLERLAACYGVTQRRFLERLLAEAERAALDRLPANAQDDYYEKRPTPLRHSGQAQLQA
jgi:hypothetical protein